MQGEIERIAASLTEAQRDVLLRHSRNAQSWAGRNSYVAPDWNEGRKLKNAGLIEWFDQRSSDTCLTPLGLAVRAHLEQHRHD